MSNKEISLNLNEFPMLELVEKDEIDKICLEIFKIGYKEYFKKVKELKYISKNILEHLHNIDYIK